MLHTECPAEDSFYNFACIKAAKINIVLSVSPNSLVRLSFGQYDDLSNPAENVALSSKDVTANEQIMKSRYLASEFSFIDERLHASVQTA